MHFVVVSVLFQNEAKFYNYKQINILEKYGKSL